ncbi:MAG: MerR family transcriptional regulator [Faecalibacterium prausnitzii]
MKINEVEAAVGVTKKNIRFYEEEGLISPSREPGNGYRSYSQADVERLRRIKLLRKLDRAAGRDPGDAGRAAHAGRGHEPAAGTSAQPPRRLGRSNRFLHAAPTGKRPSGTTGCGADACAS